MPAARRSTTPTSAPSRWSASRAAKRLSAPTAATAPKLAMAWFEGPQPTLRTDRLVLRPWRLDEGPRAESLVGAWEIADTTARIPHPYPEGGGAAWIAKHESAWRAGEVAQFAIAL